MSGGDQNGDNRHTWVCDGYMYSKYCLYFNGVYVGINEFEHLHMNWGWNGTADGWYSVDSFNPINDEGSHNLNFIKRMTINIIP